MSDTWRPLLAALASPDLRTALAEILVSERSLTPAQRARALDRLTALGVITDGQFAEAAVRAALSQASKPRPTGYERYCTIEGRIDRYPRTHDERRGFLAWVAGQTFSTDATYSEKQAGSLLERWTTDVALLRRHLVDHGVLARTADGSSYRLVDAR